MAISPPPSLPYIPHHSSSSGSFPVIILAVIGILATGFLLVGYYLFVIKCCLNWHRIDVFSSRRRTRPVDHSPENLENNTNKGLEEAIIRAIPVIKFRKLPEHDRQNTTTNTNIHNRKAHETASYECAVCLSEFEDGERLRVIPNCCHAFHIDCIDVWLQNNANCPLCRSWISPSSILHNDKLFLGSSSENPTGEKDDDDFSGGSDEEYVVIEIRDNNLDEPRLLSQNIKHEHEHKHKQKHKEKQKVVSMGDEWIEMKREKDEEFRIVQPIRRSVSMDLDREFCLEIQQCCRESSSRDCSSSCSTSGKIRRSIFGFGYYYGRNNSRGSVQPVHLSP